MEYSERDDEIYSVYRVGILCSLVGLVVGNIGDDDGEDDKVVAADRFGTGTESVVLLNSGLTFFKCATFRRYVDLVSVLTMVASEPLRLTTLNTVGSNVVANLLVTNSIAFDDRGVCRSDKKV